MLIKKIVEQNGTLRFEGEDKYFLFKPRNAIQILPSIFEIVSPSGEILTFSNAKVDCRVWKVEGQVHKLMRSVLPVMNAVIEKLKEEGKLVVLPQALQKEDEKKPEEQGGSSSGE